MLFSAHTHTYINQSKTCGDLHGIGSVSCDGKFELIAVEVRGLGLV